MTQPKQNCNTGLPPTQVPEILPEEIPEFLGITPEEIKYFQERHPVYIEQIKVIKRNPNSKFQVDYIKERLARLRSGELMNDDARRMAEAAHAARAEILSTPETNSLMTYVGYLPTDMANVSPFFPLKPNAKRDYLECHVVNTGNYGRLLYSGPQLSVYDEDVLLAILGFLKLAEARKFISETTVNDKKTYRYNGPLLPFLKALGNEKPSKLHYERFLASCRRLTSAVVELELTDKSSKNRKKPKVVQRTITNMMIFSQWDIEKKEFCLVLNPYFFELYLSNQLQTIDLPTRLAINGAVAKALYRFVVSNDRMDGQIPFRLETIAGVVNMANQPDFRKRSSLKEAIAELVRLGVLDSESGFVDKQHIRLIRVSKKMKLAAKKAPKISSRNN